MKRTLNRSIIVFLVVLAFFAGIILFTVRLAAGADDWVQKPFNGHTSGNGGLAQAGAIYDRNGTVLAQTVDGERRYNEDYATRCSLLHLVGDNSLNISTAVQSTYRTELTGYSYIWGLGLPSFLKSGNDLTLTVDSRACAAAYEVLGDRTGACVVYNYKTGEILCSVSTKTYDPQNPPEITEENEAEYDGVYLDHTMSSSFTPGSTFKIITAAAAVENIDDIDSLEIYCGGSEEIGGSEITCTGEHGYQTLDSAFANSCNVYFSVLASMLGNDKMQATADRMGFNQSFEINGIPIYPSSYNVSDADENQLAWSGVGQYTDLANPMHLAILCGAVANGGTAVMPYFIKDSGFLDSVLNKDPDTIQLMPQSTAQTLSSIMRTAVTDHYGEYLFAGLTAHAKTGTAEVGDGDPNALMVGFTSDEEHPYAFAVVVEHGGSGVSAAGEVVSAVLNSLANQ